MAIVQADNFSIYDENTGLLLNGIYANVGGGNYLQDDPDGISPGKVLKSEFDGNLRFVLPELVNVLGCSQRIWFSQLPFGSTNFLNNPTVIYDAGANPLASINIDNTGRINVRNNQSTDGDILGTTPNPAISANGWYHIETKFVQAGAFSSVEVRVEGITALTLDDIEFNNANQIASVSIRNQNSPQSNQWYCKDYVLWTDDGTYNTDFLGSVLVINLPPDADVSLNWTPSTGATGYPILDNIPPVDGQYISAFNPPPDSYVGSFTNLPADVTSVKALVTYVRAAKSDGGDASLQTGLISDPTGAPATVLGADRPITVAQTYWRDVFEEDPKTVAPWLPAAVNAARIQIDRTT